MTIADWKPGTLIADNLKKIGITPESYSSIKEAVGLPENCNCKEREQWLNDVWAWAFKKGHTTKPPEVKQSWRTRCNRRRPPK